MKLIWSDQSWNDYIFWQDTDKKIVKKINRLLKEIIPVYFINKSMFIGYSSGPTTGELIS